VKRFLATILAVIYFTASTGATVNIHYCMGKLQSMDLWHSKQKEKEKVCDNCGMTNKKGCCEDKHQVVKIEKKYNIPVTNISFTKIVSVPSQYFTSMQPVVLQEETPDFSSSNSPPGKGDIPLFICNCIYLI